MVSQEMVMNKQLDLFPDEVPVPHETSTKTGQPDSTPPLFLEPLVESEQIVLVATKLQEELQTRCGLPVALTITDNTSTMMSLRYLSNGSQVRVRLHRMFLTAPKEVRTALAYWVKHPRSRKHSVLFREFIVTRNHEIRSVEARGHLLITGGQYHNLLDIYKELNQAFFENGIDVAISWGRDSGRNTHSIRFGGYYPGECLIRIHPRLDQSFVPTYVVRYIVYHEMLHAHLGIEQTESGRRSIHPRIFKQMEKAFPEYEQAIVWIENSGNLRRMLRRTRRCASEIRNVQTH